jgi:chromosome segregation and condensation protein ScpB
MILKGEITMADLSGLSDEALAVFAFAAYHQLSSGQMVKSVVQRDGVGHKASDEAVSELKGRGLIEADGDEIRFTGEGERALQAFVSGLRGAGLPNKA